MRKIISMFTLFSFFLNACGIADRIDTHTSMERKDMVETIVDAIFENDADTICSLFAPNVQEANDDLKSDVSEFIDFFEGDYVDRDVKYGHENEGKNHYTATYRYKITTTEKEYCVLMKSCDKYEDEAKNGLISLGVQESEDYEKEDCMSNRIETAYVVTEDNHEEINALFDHIVGRDEIVVEINEENFPDEIFRNYILENFDDDVVDGKLSKYEISYNDEILLDGSKDEKSGLKSLAGIEYLEGVTCIRINYSDVSDLNLSNNSKLEVLAIEHTKIKSIDLSNCPNMRILQCDSQVEVIGYDGIKHQKHADD